MDDRKPASQETDTRWSEQAKCAQIGGDLWFTDDDYASTAKLRRAVKICSECSVAALCLEAGMEERYGVWGGFTAQQRARMRKARETKPDAA